MGSYEVIIVGGGAAGIGAAAARKRVGMSRLMLVERDEVGASFLRWPRETRFISPSFTTNGFGIPDLNAVTPDSSPAYGIRRSHMSGADYASYLRSVVATYALPLQLGIEVQGLATRGDRYVVSTNRGTLEAKCVVWAAGEHGYPRRTCLRGAELCLHTGAIRAYADLPGRHAVVIGGFESGIDAAVHLTQLGKHVHVVDRGFPWEVRAPDPSTCLSPFTTERLSRALASQRVSLRGGVSAVAIEQHGDTFVVHLDDGEHLTSDGPPILATGYDGSFSLIRDVFGYDHEGCPMLTADDESARSPGIFLVGPQVQHRQQHFCYIYKFRQRFAVVAACIAERMGLPLDALERYADANMWLDDLSCCDVACTC